jgi:hypothetical protein
MVDTMNESMGHDIIYVKMKYFFLSLVRSNIYATMQQITIKEVKGPDMFDRWYLGGVGMFENVGVRRWSPGRWHNMSLEQYEVEWCRKSDNMVVTNKGTIKVDAKSMAAFEKEFKEWGFKTSLDNNGLTFVDDSQLLWIGVDNHPCGTTSISLLCLTVAPKDTLEILAHFGFKS